MSVSQLTAEPVRYRGGPSVRKATLRAIRRPRPVTGCREVGIQEKPARDRSTFFAVKYGLDWAVAVVLCVPASAIIFVLIGLVKITSAGPGLYRQRRVGEGEREFWLYKIRTMRTDAESQGLQWSGKRDSRVTPIGVWLRRLHLDELPQILNVLRGEMSLIGPRPERPEFVAVLNTIVPAYSQRHRVRPGVTGLAQINLPPDSTVADVCRKVVLDCEYIDRTGFCFDMKIFVCTFLRMFGIKGTWVNRCCGVDRKCPTLPPDVCPKVVGLSPVEILTYPIRRPR